MNRLILTTAVAGVLALAGTGCGSDDDQEPQGASGGISAAPQSGSSTPRAYESFQLPSRNIACAMGKPGYARCDVRQKTFTSPAKPANCPLDFGSAVAVQGKKPGKFICIGDTVMNPGAPVLKYGEDSVVGFFSCSSTTVGVICRNRQTGHGFFLAREKFRVF